MENETKARRVKLKVEGNSLQFVVGKDNATAFSINFVRTLRIPDDGKRYPLPSGHGYFPIKRVDDYKDKVPAKWLEHGGVFLPMWQREAMWLSFGGRTPHALKIAAGRVNAVSGDTWEDDKLHARSGEPKQDYVVSPPQPWLDGFNIGDGMIRQFVAMPLGMGYTVEGQVTGKETHGGLQIQVYPAKEGKFPTLAPQYTRGGGVWASMGASMTKGVGGSSAGVLYANSVHDGAAATMDFSSNERGISLSDVRAEMGLASGGKMTQKIYDDPHGIDTWDQEIRGGRVFVHLVNSQMWEQITGEKMPPSPISKDLYRAHRYPWFELYDESVPSVGGSDVLACVKSVAEKDTEHGFTGQMDNTSVDIPGTVKLAVQDILEKNEVRDGKW